MSNCKAQADPFADSDGGEGSALVAKALASVDRQQTVQITVEFLLNRGHAHKGVSTLGFNKGALSRYCSIRTIKAISINARASCNIKKPGRHKRALSLRHLTALNP